MRTMTCIATALLLSACTDEEARDQAATAEERAASAAAHTEELEKKLSDLEDRVAGLELSEALSEASPGA